MEQTLKTTFQTKGYKVTHITDGIKISKNNNGFVILKFNKDITIMETFVRSTLIENIDKVYLAIKPTQFAQGQLDKDRIIKSVSEFLSKLPKSNIGIYAELYTKEMNDRNVYAGVIKSYTQTGSTFEVTLHDDVVVKVRLATPSRMKIGHILVTSKLGKTNVFTWNAFKGFFDMSHDTYGVLKTFVIEFNQITTA